jgi:hypothetical protein
MVPVKFDSGSYDLKDGVPGWQSPMAVNPIGPLQSFETYIYVGSEISKRINGQSNVFSSLG